MWDLELANANVQPGGKSAVVVTVTDSDGAAVGGVEVELGATYGYLSDTIVTTNPQGKAQAIFTAPQGERTGKITAQVGLATATTRPVTVAYVPNDARDLAVNHAALIGDKTSAGTIVHNRYDGVPLEIAYPTTQTIRAIGNQGDSVTVHIGDDFDPNLPPLAAYYMNHIYEEVTDETGRYPLHQRAVQIVSGTRMGAGSRYQFDADEQSLVYGDALTLLQQNADLGFSLEVMPGNGHTSEDGELVNLGQGALVLSYGDNRYRLKLRTANGEFTATSAPAMAGLWYQVAARYTNGQLYLNVNGNVFTTPATGDLDFDWTNNSETAQLDPNADHDLLLGQNYTGGLKSLKWYSLVSSPLMTFDNGAVSQTVTIGAEGYTPLTLRSQGNLHQNGSAINLQRVAVYTQNVREYASVLSTEAFAQIAGMYAVTLDRNAPPINIAGLENAGQLDFFAQHNIRFALFNEAQAGVLDFAWDAVNWILPLESFATVFQQLGYLAGVGEGEFEADVFIIALVDVVTVLPPAKPLAAFTRPLKALTKGLKNTNPRFMRYFAGALNGAVRKARKGDFDTLWNTLPFMVLAAQMWMDEDSRKGLEFLVSTVDSGDDVLSWIDYLALPAGDWEGNTVPEVDPFGSEDPISSWSPLSLFIAEAHAQTRLRKISSSVLAAALVKASRRISKEYVENVPDALKELTKAIKNGEAKELRKYIFSPSKIAAATSLVVNAGARSLRNFLTGKTNARYHPVHVLAMIGYLEWEGACGKALDILSGEYEGATDAEEAKANESLDGLECGGKGLTGRRNRAELYKLYTRTFVDSASGEFDEEPTGYTIGGYGHGSLFHIAQITNHQLLYRTGGEPIKEIEGIRRIWLYEDSLSKTTHSREPNLNAARADLQGVYDRHVDLIIGSSIPNSQEKWVELKSYSGTGETPSIYLDILNQRAGAKPNSIQSWKPRGEKEKASDDKGINLHRQFTLDRAASYVGHARRQLTGGVHPLISVHQDFKWCFQKFNRTWKSRQGVTQKSLSVDLGSADNSKSVKGGLVQDIDGARGEFKDVVDANIGHSINADGHIEYCTAGDMLQSLAQIGFSEVLEISLEE